MFKTLIISFFVWMLFLPNNTGAQNRPCYLNIKGAVKRLEDVPNDSIVTYKNARIQVLQDEDSITEYSADENGRFDIRLEIDQVYLLVFGDSSAGYVEKRMLFNTFNVPDQICAEGGFLFSFDITLFRVNPLKHSKVLN